MAHFGARLKAVINRLGLISNTILGLPMWWLYHNFIDGVYIFTSVIIGLFIGALALILKKDELQFSADNPDKPTIFLQVDRGRASVIEMGGRPIRVIHGGEIPPFTLSWFGLWWLYQAIVFRTIGLYAYIWYFTNVKYYALPRYRITEEGGRVTYVAVKPGDTGYRSDHLRTALTTKPYKYSGVDVQKVPVEVDCSAQYHISRGKVIDIYYKIEAWNVLLDQALGATIRSVMRSHVTVDDILGSVPKGIWDEVVKPSSADLSSKVASLVKQGLDEYKVKIETVSSKWFGLRQVTETTEVTLAELGIVISRVDITDFKDELTPAQRSELLAAVLGREAGRAADLKGQGVAKAQRSLKEAHGTGDGASTAIIDADALVRAAQSQGGAVDAIAAAFARRLMKGN